MKENAKVNAKQLEKILKEKEIVIVDFFATWCGPCQMFIPVFDKVSEKLSSDKIAMVFVDIDEEKELSIKNDVKGVPTIVAFKNGKEVARFSGFRPPEELINFINKV